MAVPHPARPGPGPAGFDLWEGLERDPNPWGLTVVEMGERGRVLFCFV